jgi:hypothetical protein
VADDQGPIAQHDEQRRQDVWDATRKELAAAKSSNSEAYDKAVLTLSSAFLGVSLAFLKDSASSHPVAYVPLLLASWICLSLAIISTLISFQLSNFAADAQMDLAERYYAYRDENALKRQPIARYVDYVNWTSGSLFIFGVFLTVAFVSFNFTESNSMSKKPGPSHAMDGQTVSKMQQVGTVQKGATINNMQKVPPAPAPAAPPAPAPTTTTK